MSELVCQELYEISTVFELIDFDTLSCVESRLEFTVKHGVLCDYLLIVLLCESGSLFGHLVELKTQRLKRT